MPQYRMLKINGKPGGIEQVWDHDFAPALEELLKGYEDAPVKNVADLVQWNLANADRELPEGAVHHPLFSIPARYCLLTKF